MAGRDRIARIVACACWWGQGWHLRHLCRRTDIAAIVVTAGAAHLECLVWQHRPKKNGRKALKDIFFEFTAEPNLLHKTVGRRQPCSKHSVIHAPEQFQQHSRIERKTHRSTLGRSRPHVPRNTELCGLGRARARCAVLGSRLAHHDHMHMPS